MTKIKDILPATGSTALFTLLSYYAPWGTEINATRLNTLYLTHSGNKICGPIFDILTNDGEDDLNMTDLARTICDFYQNKWARLWAVRGAEYEPLENYNMEEKGTINQKGTNTQTTSSQSENESSSTSTSNAAASDNTGRYGFASATPVGTDTADTTSETAGTTAGKGTASGTETAAGEDTRDTEHTLTRTGNIGIRSSQELLTQEIELWQWTFFENVFIDIDKLIALSVY